MNHRHTFGPNWWGRHPNLTNCRWGFYNRPWRSWWRPATWVGVTGWIAWTWPQPVFYDFGGSIYYENNEIYVDGNPVASAQEYAQQMGELANSVPDDVNADDVEWLPLGVFALLKDDGDEAVMFLQLAVSKEGIIAGTYTNSTNDSAQTVEGMVDRETQMAAWTIGDNKKTVLQTGVYNLTQDETPVLVHFGTEQTQQWLMVRLDEPEESEAAPE